MDAEERLGGLGEIASEVSRCTACKLCQSATNAVPGEGPANARVMFIGEAPGHQEDRLGRPFVGPAGKLLDELLHGIGLRREDVFITNVVKHRPPGNRDPEQEEIEACWGYLERQLELVDPEVVATLGRFAMERFLPGSRISDVRGKPRRLGDRKFIPLVHPAAALHRGDWRPKLHEDFAALADLLRGEESFEARAIDEDSSAEQLSLF